MSYFDAIVAMLPWVPLFVVIAFLVFYNSWLRRQRTSYDQAISASMEMLELNKRMLDELQQIKTLLKERGSKE